MKNRWIAATMAAALLATGVSIPGAQAESGVREKVKTIRNQKNNLLDKIEAKNEEMARLKKELKKIENQLFDVKEEYGPVLNDYLNKRKEAQKYEQRFKKQLTNMYVQGDTNYLARLLQAESFDEFLQRFEVLRIIAQEDHETWTEYSAKVKQMEKSYGKVLENVKKQEALVEEFNKKLALLVEEQKKFQEDLEEVNHELEMYEDVVVQINLEEWRSGKLKFPYTGPLSRPTNTRMTSSYGYRRHPIFGTLKRHEGVDFAGPSGVPIYAAADGVVVSSEPVTGYGWLITIYHGHKGGVPVFTRYAHMYSRTVRVRVGEEVRKGQQIAAVGSNGYSTGPHLHFEVRVGYDQEPRDPMNYFE